MSSATVGIIHGIWQLLTPKQRRTAVLLIALMSVGAALETLGIGLVVVVLRSTTNRASMFHGPPVGSWVHNLTSLDSSLVATLTLTAFVGVALIKALFIACLVRGQARFVSGVQADLSSRLFDCYLRQPYVFHLERNSAELIRNAIHETSLFAVLGLSSVLTLISEGMVSVAVGSVLLVVAMGEALLVIAVLTGAAWIFHRLTRAHVSQLARNRQSQEGVRLRYLQEGLACAKEVAVRGCASALVARYTRQSESSA